MRRKAARLGLLAVATGCLVPASAAAGTATVFDTTQGRGSEPVQYVRYSGAPREANRVTARLTVSGGSGTATLTDPVGIRPGRGCTRPDPANPTVASCRLGDGGTTSSVAANAFEFRLGDGNDVAQIVGSPATSGEFDGGTGNDVLRAGDGVGGGGEDPGLPSGAVLRGGPGNDVLEGGEGDDRLVESGASATGSDVLRGGDGIDRVSYAGRVGRIRADLAGDRDDGERREHDLIADVENLVGGRAGDRLTGNGRANVLVGDGGTDILVGGGGDDSLHSAAEDFVPGGARTRDRLAGGRGNDYLVGTAGPNRFLPGPGADTVGAGGGADRVRARDRFTDAISCGRGRDRVLLDATDAIARGCERVRRRGRARAVFVTQVRVLGLLGSEARPYADPTIACPADLPAGCRVTVTLSRRGTVLGRARARIRRGASTEVFTNLNAAGRRLAGRRVNVRLTVRTALRGRAFRSATYVVPLGDHPG